MIWSVGPHAATDTCAGNRPRSIGPLPVPARSKNNVNVSFRHRAGRSLFSRKCPRAVVKLGSHLKIAFIWTATGLKRSAAASRDCWREMRMTGVFVVVWMFMPVAGVDPNKIEYKRTNTTLGPHGVGKLT